MSSGMGRRTSWAAITLVYLLIEVAIRDSNDGNDAARASLCMSVSACSIEPLGSIFDVLLVNLKPSLLNLLTDWLADSRWDDSAGVPSQKASLTSRASCHITNIDISCYCYTGRQYCSPLGAPSRPIRSRKHSMPRSQESRRKITNLESPHRH